MLAATLATVIVFFPVTFLYGVSRYLFGALALAVILSLFASYFVAMTVVPLFCAKLIKIATRGRRGMARSGARTGEETGARVSIAGSTADSGRCSTVTKGI